MVCESNSTLLFIIYELINKLINRIPKFPFSTVFDLGRLKMQVKMELFFAESELFLILILDSILYLLYWACT